MSTAAAIRPPGLRQRCRRTARTRLATLRAPQPEPRTRLNLATGTAAAGSTGWVSGPERRSQRLGAGPLPGSSRCCCAVALGQLQAHGRWPLPVPPPSQPRPGEPDRWATRAAARSADGRSCTSCRSCRASGRQPHARRKPRASSPRASTSTSWVPTHCPWVPPRPPRARARARRATDGRPWLGGPPRPRGDRSRRERLTLTFDPSGLVGASGGGRRPMGRKSRVGGSASQRAGRRVWGV